MFANVFIQCPEKTLLEISTQNKLNQKLNRNKWNKNIHPCRDAKEATEVWMSSSFVWWPFFALFNKCEKGLD